MKKKFKNQREMARRRRLPTLLKMHNNKCYWCKEPIVMRREIGENQIIQEEHGQITFMADNHLYQFKLASVDHVVELAEGGTNDWNNCVPACWFCNNERSNGKQSALFNSNSGL